MKIHHLLLVIVLCFTGAASAGDINVRDAGAQGDGRTDDTAAFQKALDDVGKTGGRVNVPGGHYVIRGHLSIPDSVELCGSFDAPARTQYTEGKLEKEAGSILLAYEGKNDAGGTPFITLHRASHLHGLIIFYPEQTDDALPYPWTIRGVGDNCTITAMLIINPYQCVDFGTEPCGRHLIDGLYAQPLKTGIFIDKCFDVGRIANVHFWPFWRDSDKLYAITRKGTAFLIARTDWEYMSSCFCIQYGIGYHFIANKDGPGNAVLTNCGSDIGPRSVKVDQTQAHAGVSFVNGQFMSSVEIGPENEGPVKFTACGFWGTPMTASHVISHSHGNVTLDACHFIGWAQSDKNAPCIAADAGGITINACEFLDREPTKRHINLGPNVQSAIITSNRFRSEPKIDNQSKGDVQIGLNTSPKR